MRALALFSLLVLSSGCSSATFRAPSYDMPATCVGGMVVEFEHDVSVATYEFSKHAVEYTVEAWERDLKAPTKPVTVSVTEHQYIYVGREEVNVFGLFTMVSGERATGECSIDNGVYSIRVTTGQFDTLPSLFHELCHLNVHGMLLDSKHTDPRWYEWDNRGAEISRELRSQWFDWRSSNRFEELQNSYQASQ